MDKRMRLVLVVIAALLFSGCEPKSDPLPTYGAVPDGVFVASARNMESRGLMWVSSPPAEGRFTTDLPQQVIAAPTVMILIHGYNTPAAKVSAYFEGLISYLRIDRDYHAPMVIYDWKSTARHWEDVPFEEQQAYTEFLASTVGERLGGRVRGCRRACGGRACSTPAIAHRPRPQGWRGLFGLCSRSRADDKT